MADSSVRTRGDLCPGVLRPWQAEDGLLVRLRLVGGLLTGAQLDALLAVSECHGDGAVHLTGRANLQVRGLAGDGCLSEQVIEAFEATGLLPSRDHDLVRNILVSPQSGYAGGRADLRPVAAALDELLRADRALGSLPGRFLFVLDDGRGDLLQTRADLGAVALADGTCQLRIGDGWGPVVPVDETAGALAELARAFLAARGTGPGAAWHVRELPSVDHAESSSPIDRTLGRSAGIPLACGPLRYGPVDGGTHVPVEDGRLTRASAQRLLLEPTLIVTPWRGIFVPSFTPGAREH